MIGGSVAGAGNLISGNNADRRRASGATGNIVQGNRDRHQRRRDRRGPQ